MSWRSRKLERTAVARGYGGQRAEVPAFIAGKSHYYPFGMKHLGPWYETVAPENKYLYNGKELNEDYEINLMDYGARWYDGAIGRWTAVDPLAEDAPDWTPYRFAFDNPLSYIDPDGLFETKKEAKQYAKDSGIRTGLFSQNKVREQSDGTYAIENEREKTSISDLGEGLGVMTATMVSPTDVMDYRVVSDGNPWTSSDIRFEKILRDGSVVDGGPALITGTAPTPGKPHLNSNKAVGDFATYTIKVLGRIFKIGKADVGRVTKSSGLPTRVHQQVRKLTKKYGQGNVDASISPIGKTTTKEAKRIEKSVLKKIFKRTGEVPPGNQRSFKPGQ